MDNSRSFEPSALHLTLAVPEGLVNKIADAVVARLGDSAAASPQSPWLDVAGAAAYLNTTSDAVRKAVLRGQLPGHQPYGRGSRWLFHRDELDAFVLGTHAPKEMR